MGVMEKRYCTNDAKDGGSRSSIMLAYKDLHENALLPRKMKMPFNKSMGSGRGFANVLSDWNE